MTPLCSATPDASQYLTSFSRPPARNRRPSLAGPRIRRPVTFHPRPVRAREDRAGSCLSSSGSPRVKRPITAPAGLTDERSRARRASRGTTSSPAGSTRAAASRALVAPSRHLSMGSVKCARDACPAREERVARRDARSVATWAASRSSTTLSLAQPALRNTCWWRSDQVTC
jgi:hypothetical protein